MSELSELKALVVRIDTAISGDSKYGNDGIAGDIGNIKKTLVKFDDRIGKIERRLFREKVIVGTVVGTASAGATWLSKSYVAKAFATLFGLGAGDKMIK